MLEGIKKWFSTASRDEEVARRIEELRSKMPTPVFWLLGKTQSGKTSIIRYLTDANDAEIGQGFAPCTRFARRYDFPTREAALLTFLDTRGLEEPGYDPAEEIAAFHEQAHMVIVTVKALDHALENLLTILLKIKSTKPGRPILVAATCLHEAYPLKDHSVAYSDVDWDRTAPTPELAASLAELRRRFEGLADAFVPMDLTPAAEGFAEPNYGGPKLKEKILELLPQAQRQTLLDLDRHMATFQDVYERHAMPYLVAYSSLAASVGAIPIPWIDLFLLPGIQARMIFHLGEYYGQPLSAQRFMELAGSLGMGILMRQAVREVVKIVPFVGSAVSATLAGAATFALGKAFCFYFSKVRQGHVPQPEDLKRYYHEQLAQAEKMWRSKPDSGNTAAEMADPAKPIGAEA